MLYPVQYTSSLSLRLNNDEELCLGIFQIKFLFEITIKECNTATFNINYFSFGC